MKGDPGRPENWYQLARRDLDKARRDLAQGDLPYAAIAFQQAAEKACKGWLIAHGWRLVKTHDLVFLIGEIRQHGQDTSWFDKSAALLSKEFFERHRRARGVRTGHVPGFFRLFDLEEEESITTKKRLEVLPWQDSFRKRWMWPARCSKPTFDKDGSSSGSTTITTFR